MGVIGLEFNEASADAVLIDDFDRLGMVVVMDSLGYLSEAGGDPLAHNDSHHS
ncbi:hypothetical protein FHT44_005022 [Mycolicibacterium sp. BK634]|uniref:hypothetical protein n=1 Tax=Mycolicibacterium sp. BK634 TaxID=2587099 RepID=UPI00161CC452|nr:hypothetical protein [Mycolicibacterium sp. BK634]MBB3752510.1 hypothetical protein [Mycolicibacterium sp. BK634]